MTIREYQVIADGIVWADPDGETVFPHSEALALAEDLERRRGYTDVEVCPV